jgi:hypothetical protein
MEDLALSATRLAAPQSPWITIWHRQQFAAAPIRENATSY